MHVLVTNDDGIESAGLAALVKAALGRGHTVQVAAPAHEYSGASASLAGEEKDGKIVLVKANPPEMPEGVDCIGVKAAPGLIAFLASYGAFGDKPDLIMSGCNLGANTGHATLHSGTVGAAHTAVTHDIPGLAVSVTSGEPENWDTVQRITDIALEWLEKTEFNGHVLNINVPDVPWSRLRGLRGAHLAPFGAVQARIDERFTEGIDVTYIAEDADEEPGSDHHLLTQGWATATWLRAPVDNLDLEVPEFMGEGTEDDVEEYRPDSARVMTTRESD